MDFAKIAARLRAIATEYKNRNLIGDEIAPAVKTPSTSFKYNVWDKKNNFTVPETVVGKFGEFKEVHFSGSEETGSVTNHGLKTVVSDQDITDYEAIGDNQLLERNSSSLRNVMLLRREVAIAKAVQNPANYAAVTTYTPANSWLSPDSDPIKDIQDAIALAVVPYNRMWFSQDSWLAFTRHPKVISRLFPHSAGGVAMVTEKDVALLLSLDKIVVGKSILNTAEPGKTPVITPAFNASAGLFVYEEQTFLNSAMNFLTQVYKPSKGYSNSFERLSVNVKQLDLGESGFGSKEISMGEQIALINQGKDLGYLFKNTTGKPA